MNSGSDLVLGVPGALIKFALICWVLGTIVSSTLNWLKAREERRLAETVKETFE